MQPYAHKCCSYCVLSDTAVPVTPVARRILAYGGISAITIDARQGFWLHPVEKLQNAESSSGTQSTVKSAGWLIFQTVPLPKNKSRGTAEDEESNPGGWLSHSTAWQATSSTHWQHPPDVDCRRQSLPLALREGARTRRLYLELGSELGVTFTPNCQNKNAYTSVNSSICFVTGFPAPCPAFDSMRNKIGRVLLVPFAAEACINAAIFFACMGSTPYQNPPS